MQLSVKLSSIELAKARLATVGRTLEPAMRGALNATATRVRRERYVQPLNKSLKGKLVRSSMRIKRARRGMMNARIIPSSSGVPVTRYASWGYDPIDKTRARLWVRAPNGRKIAAGFVNPASVAKRPWRTRGLTRRTAGSLPEALGPSVAYWFRQLSDRETVRWTNSFLQQEFEMRIRKEIAKGAK